MDILEIAKECGITKFGPDDDCYMIVGTADLQQFAQRIEQPHKQRIVELEQQIDTQLQDVGNLQAAQELQQEQIEQLREALQAYRDARAMPSYADYAAIAYTPPEKTYDSYYGGGDCSRHGRYYGRGCISCENEWRKIKAQADRDAAHARDNALRKADDKARKALEGK